jgi:DNA-directed RNA polymerase II subunit RPB2
LAYFLNESFLIRGDEYYMAVCNKTGAISIYNEERNLFLSPYADGPINFHTNPDGSMNIKNLSRFGRSFSLLRIPYSFKLLIQELQVMNIQMRIITEENIDQLMSMSYSNNIYKLLHVPEDQTKEQLEKTIRNYTSSINRVVNITKPELKLDEIKELPIPVEELDIETKSISTESPPYAPGSPAYMSESSQGTPGSYNPESPPYVPGTTQPIVPESPPPQVKESVSILEVPKEPEEKEEEKEKEKEGEPSSSEKEEKKVIEMPSESNPDTTNSNNIKKIQI